MDLAKHATTHAVEADFGRPMASVRFWRQLVCRACPPAKTPFYLFSLTPLKAAWKKLAALSCSLPIRHWFSCKTQPVKPVLEWWRREGRGLEVVSEFELLAAINAGFPPRQILVNGPAKHAWLPRYRLPGLRVNLDSPGELKGLLPLARQQDWSVGVRCRTRAEVDPDHSTFPAQFGLDPAQAVSIIKQLQRASVRLETVHFHLRTNVADPRSYEAAISEVHQVCVASGFAPKYLDCGGGFPPPYVRTHRGEAYDADFAWSKLPGIYERAARLFPTLQEIWLENGRFLCAGSGVLVVRVMDIKERAGHRVLICDGGRTTQALISQWETHELLTWPVRRGPKCLTTVCGPTCMAFDQLARRRLPSNIQTGDCLIWMDAGAYHVPWETRFSHGAAAIWWHDDNQLRIGRPPETFASWWGPWT